MSEISYMPEISMKLEKVSLNEVEDMNLLKNEQQIESIIIIVRSNRRMTRLLEHELFRHRPASGIPGGSGGGIIVFSMMSAW